MYMEIKLWTTKLPSEKYATRNTEVGGYLLSIIVNTILHLCSLFFFLASYIYNCYPTQHIIALLHVIFNLSDIFFLYLLHKSDISNNFSPIFKNLESRTNFKNIVSIEALREKVIKRRCFLSIHVFDKIEQPYLFYYNLLSFNNFVNVIHLHIKEWIFNVIKS